MADLSPHPLAVAQLPLPAAVLLHVEAAQRGFKNALAFRRWCRKHHVPVRRDGHRLWVKRGDVDRAVEAVEAWDARRRARLTVTEAAERCGVSPHTIRRALLLRVAAGLLEGDAPARPGLAWSVTPADADGAMAMLRGTR